MRTKTSNTASFGKLALILLAVTSTLALTSKANVVTDWNALTVGHAAAGGRPGPSWVLDVAVVQVAVYDAVQGIEGDYQPYCGSIPGASGSLRAAVSKAAVPTSKPGSVGSIPAIAVA